MCYEGFSFLPQSLIFSRTILLQQNDFVRKLNKSCEDRKVSLNRVVKYPSSPIYHIGKLLLPRTDSSIALIGKLSGLSQSGMKLRFRSHQTPDIAPNEPFKLVAQ